ncbi:MAG: hypothetical protein FJ279_25400, partial [Planctomycetes bacterium]|nr:hypothetical protein [Planctomycetota bacterium]
MHRRLVAGVAVGLILVLGLTCLGAEKQEDKVAPKPPPVPPPVQYLLSELSAEGEVAGDLAKFTATVKAESLVDGIVLVPLFSTDVSITKAEVSGPVFGGKG